MQNGNDDIPYWVLVSVLFSTHPLSESLALALHSVAFELYRAGGSSAQLDRDDAHGEVRNLKKDALLGTVGGPVFEAELETPRGKGLVRFLLTRQGLELQSQRQAAAVPRQSMMN